MQDLFREKTGVLSERDWPAKSPDLNLSGLMWEQIDRDGMKNMLIKPNSWEVQQETRILQISSTNCPSTAVIMEEMEGSSMKVKFEARYCHFFEF